jgi:integrase
MASVYKHHGKWWCRLKDESGRWRSRSTELPDTDDERKAQRLADKAQALIDEHRQAGATSGPITVAGYAERWAAEREARGIGAAMPDLRLLRKYVFPAIGHLPLTEVRPRHARDIVRGLRQAGELAPRTIIAVHRTARSLFESAIGDELLETNPIHVKRGELPAKVDKDPEWRALATYTTREVEQLISDEQIPVERRVQYALKAIAGLRHGEVAGLRWRHHDPTLEPLGRLVIATSYDTGRTKTEVTRRVPVHPTLGRILAAWKLSHWERIYGRAPGPDDYVVPTRTLATVDASDAVHAFKADLAALGLRVDAGAHRDRGGHDLRAWFITTCQEHGAHRDLLRVVTHTAKGDVVSGYTRAQWPALCAEVGKLRISTLGGDVLPLATNHATTELSVQNRWRKRATPTGFEFGST